MNIPLVLKFLFAGFGNKVQPSNRPPPSRSAAINRWTGKPHEHKREKARRIRNGVAPDPIF